MAEELRRALEEGRAAYATMSVIAQRRKVPHQVIRGKLAPFVLPKKMTFVIGCSFRPFVAL